MNASWPDRPISYQNRLIIMQTIENEEFFQQQWPTNFKPNPKENPLIAKTDIDTDTDSTDNSFM